MNFIKKSPACCLLFAVVLISGAIKLSGGHPGPPRVFTLEEQQANTVLVRWQEALAGERWQEAMELCSPRVRTNASAWSTPKEFFKDTVPIKQVLAFKWLGSPHSPNLYIMLFTISDEGVIPPINWFWGLAASTSGYQIDYPPLKLDALVAKKQAQFREYFKKRDAALDVLEQKSLGLSMHLSPVSDRFVFGAPMLFRLELTNAGSFVVPYRNDTGYGSWSVLNEKQEQSRHGGALNQGGQRGGPQVVKLPVHASVVLVDKYDLNSFHSMTNPGRYQVQFDGSGFNVCEHQNWGPHLFDPFDELGPMGRGAPTPLVMTNLFPSNPVEIEVIR